MRQINHNQHDVSVLRGSYLLFVVPSSKVGSGPFVTNAALCKFRHEGRRVAGRCSMHQGLQCGAISLLTFTALYSKVRFEPKVANDIWPSGHCCGLVWSGITGYLLVALDHYISVKYALFAQAGVV